jgi:hypothetical protein
VTTSPVKCCWQCGYPFSIARQHKKSGYDLVICANLNCNAPHDLFDDIAFEVMKYEAKRYKPSAVYLREWRKQRRLYANLARRGD